MNRTNAALRRRFVEQLSSPSTLLLAAALTGCGSIGEGPQGPSNEDQDKTVNSASPDDEGGSNNGGGEAGGGDTGGAPGGSTGSDTAAPPATDKCAQTAQDAKAVMSTHCASCHGPTSPGDGGFATVLDVDALVTSGKVKPGNPDESPIYVRMSTGSMPPSKKTLRPSANEISTVRDWIACNAPDWDAAVPGAQTVPFMSVDERLTKLLSNVKSVTNPVDRRRMRYLDLSHLGNSGMTQAKLDEYRESVALLLNSLSYGANVIAPQVVKGSNDTLYRIDLRDFGFTAADWEAIIADYPYVVRYDEDSAKFPFLENTAEQLRDETGTDVPFIQVDWLLAHASQPPLYYQILKMPTNVAGIAAKLGINIASNIQNEEVARAGFAQSGVSVNNRIIERHEQPGNQGAFWVSYDFAGNVGSQNIFANPLDFTADGGEGFFNLPNGLQAYFIIDAAGNLLDKAPTNVVTDPHSRDRAVIAGLSCMSSCHFSDGIIPKNDSIRAVAGNFGGSDEDTILRIYPTEQDMLALMTADQEIYRQSRTSLGVVKTAETTLMRAVNAHLDTLTIDMVAASLGITTEALRSSLDNPRLPDEIKALAKTGGTVHRDVFENLFNVVITEIGLGAPLRQ